MLSAQKIRDRYFFYLTLAEREDPVILARVDKLVAKDIELQYKRHKEDAIPGKRKVMVIWSGVAKRLLEILKVRDK